MRLIEYLIDNSAQQWMAFWNALMPTFQYEAMNGSGDEFTDEIEAVDERSARHQLSQRGMFVTKLVATSTASMPTPVESTRDSRPSSCTPLTSRHPDLGQRHAREKRAMGFGIAVMGGLAVLFGIWMACDAVPFVLSATSATGLCVGQEYNSSDNDYNIPVVEFTVDGKKHRVESRGILGMQFKSGYRKGHRMTVLYPPGHPDEARVGGIVGNLQFPVAFLGIGGVFVLSGAWLVRRQTKVQQGVGNE